MAWVDRQSLTRRTIAELDYHEFITTTLLTGNQTQYKKINGKEIGFFVDVKNEYGFNENTEPDGTGGYPTWLATTDGMTLLLTNPNRSAMITFENTLGLMLSRDRQPTGRMLADILNRSFADTQMTSFGFGRGAEAVSSYQVLSNYTFIFNQLAKNRANALYDSGLTDDKNDINQAIFS